ncbi:hypothetical protein TOPH_00288 [Tolypocladium ophioglossoides CBS 100239]|uniref:Uncharacterized protein n=1 Tax=Tolypocladium ophioglossoides (strain CBS 100239) TaxID=1163406 RepID=A0A0L0NM07_TOLOC|nr:hypothetical protein TOPH_00288 [Tolypocladium ophioglossoides CBS 100239]
MESPSTSKGGPESPSRPSLDSAMPALAQVYSHKPLPPLPPTSRPNPMASRSSTASAERREPISRPRAATAAESAPSTPAHVRTRTLSSPRSHARRISYSGLSATGRRSSHKVQQLIGYDIDIMEDCPFSYGSVDSDASSNCSQKWDGEPNLPPLLDSGATSSRGSSWVPMSPQSAAVPSPLNISKLAIRDSSDSNLGGSFSPDVDVDLDEESAQSWEPSCRHFSDSMAAGEYHRIAADLATRPTRQTRAARSTSQASAGRMSSSLSLSHSASSRFARWRSTPPRAIDFAMPPLAMPSVAMPLLASGSHRRKPLASQPPVKAAPVSVFDADSDGEERSHGIKEWFGRKSDDHVPSDRPALHNPALHSTKRHHHEPGARASHGEQMRGLLHHARDRAKMLHMPKEERRREELRRHIKVLPS